jgi:hypothetical protein
MIALMRWRSSSYTPNAPSVATGAHKVSSCSWALNRLVGHKIHTFKHLKTHFCRKFALFSANLLQIAHALAFVAMNKPQIAIWPWSGLFLER